MARNYKIRFAGSTFAGENPIKKDVNTLAKIIKQGKKHGFRNTTRVSKVKGKRKWIFNGNYIRKSSVFWVEIFNQKLANKIRNVIRRRKKR